MIFIAHRGNIEGPHSDWENTLGYINQAITRGFDCEVDIRYIDKHYWLGHDYPKSKVINEMLSAKQIWFHAKDGTTLRQALKDKLHVFYDDNPNMNYALTSRGFIWHWDGKSMIYVMDKNGLIGICSDYVGYLHG
jgi:hypothetical protein